MSNILITGASSGIGKALAENYASDKNTLFLLARNKKRLEEVKKECEERGAKVEIKILDVRNRLEMKKYIESLDSKGLDMIFANAGISAGTSGGIEDDQQVYDIFDTNLTGVLNTINPVLPYFIKRKKGKIFIISSLAGYIALPSCPAYSASKAAVRFYGNALNDNVKKHNVSVRVISPGYVKSRITDANNFRMPFLMEADEAAKLIEIKINGSNNPNIAFPWPLYFTTWFVGIISRRITGFFLRMLPGKKGLKK